MAPRGVTRPVAQPDTARLATVGELDPGGLKRRRYLPHGFSRDARRSFSKSTTVGQSHPCGLRKTWLVQSRRARAARH